MACFAVAALWSAAVHAQERASYAGRSVAQWAQVLAEHVEQDTTEDKEETRRAAQALGVIGPPAKTAVPVLIQALQSPSLEVRQFAVDALGRIGPDAAGSVPAIIQEADIPRDHRFYTPLTLFRRLAAKALGSMGPDAAAAVPLLEAALDNEDVLYRVEAALALWRINRHPRAVEVLKPVVSLDEPQGPFEAVIALGKMGRDAGPAAWTLVEALGHGQSDVRRAAAKVLLGFGSVALAPLAKRLEETSAEDPRPAAFATGQLLGQVREHALSGGEIKPATQEAVDAAGAALAKLLASQSESVRQTASRSLSQMGLAAIPHVLEMLDSDLPATRQAAAHTLVRIEPYLPQEPSAEVDRVKQQILPPLMQLMDHEDPKVQAAVFRAFAELQFGDAGSEAIPLLRNALRDPDVAIRRHAAKALKQYEDD